MQKRVRLADDATDDEPGAARWDRLEKTLGQSLQQQQQSLQQQQKFQRESNTRFTTMSQKLSAEAKAAADALLQQQKHWQLEQVKQAKRDHAVAKGLPAPDVSGHQAYQVIGAKNKFLLNEHKPTSGQLCTFWTKSKCKRGNACPHKHDGPGGCV